MARAIDSEVAFRFLTEQLVKETGAFSKGVNKGLNIARSAMRNPYKRPEYRSMEDGSLWPELTRMTAKRHCTAKVTIPAETTGRTGLPTAARRREKHETP